MIDIPVLRWGQPYDSLEKDTVVHFDTGEELATVSLANGGLIQRDMRKAQRARDVLREIPPRELIEMVKKAAGLYKKEELPLGNGTQRPDDFVKYQSATTGLPEHMCRANMEKNHFVLTRMDEVLGALTRGLDLSILNDGYGVEERGVTLSYQAQSPVLGIGLALQLPGRAHAVDAGHTAPNWSRLQARTAGAVDTLSDGGSILPGGSASGRRFPSIRASGISARQCSQIAGRSMIFGGQPTVERHKGDPRVQVHGPGFSKILLGRRRRGRLGELSRRHGGQRSDQ